jgi:hypothetical protein
MLSSQRLRSDEDRAWGPTELRQDADVQPRQLWRTLLVLAIAAVPLVGLSVVGVPLAAVILIVTALGLLGYFAIYSVRIQAALRFLEESNRQADLEAVAIGVPAPAYVWSGTNGWWRLLRARCSCRASLSERHAY